MANIRNLIYQDVTVQQPVYDGTNLTKWIHDGVVIWENGGASTRIVKFVDPIFAEASSNFQYTYSSGYPSTVRRVKQLLKFYSLSNWTTGSYMYNGFSYGYVPEATYQVISPTVEPPQTYEKEFTSKPWVMVLTDIGQEIKVVVPEFWTWFGSSHGTYYIDYAVISGACLFSDKPFKLHSYNNVYYESIEYNGKYYLCKIGRMYRTESISTIEQDLSLFDIEYKVPKIAKSLWVTDEEADFNGLTEQFGTYITSNFDSVYSTATALDLEDTSYY